MFTTAVYDLDGIIIDSEPLWRKAMITGFSQVGLQLTEDDCRRTTGMRLSEVVQHWYKKSSWKSKSVIEVEANIVDILCDFIQTEGRGMDGMLYSLEFFKKRNINLGIATSSSHKILHTVLDTLQIKSEFLHLQSAENLKFGKPHPEVYLCCAEAMRVNALECLAIEDSLNGIVAAKAAGMKVVAVPEKHNFDDQRFSLADLKISSLNDLSDHVIHAINF